jgi:uncharacterized SAM-binding protein YcdF (DUF218 family)
MRRRILLSLILIVGLLFVFRSAWLGALGHALVEDDPAASADVAIVLATGVDYPPRLIQAARLYRDKRVKYVLINGNRKTDVLRELEQQGFVRAAPWYENSLRILEMLGVPRERVWTVSVEDAFDTVSEAQGIVPTLRKRNVDDVIITTSKFHTRRARYVWQKVLKRKDGIYASAADSDPFDPDSWWTEGRQVRQLLAEYGSLIYYMWKQPWES